MTRTRTDSGSQRGRSKWTLYCPTCGHAAAVDGDWDRESRTSGTAYVCPECESTVTVRRSFDEDDTGETPPVITH
ncbi:hypothetical protein [Haloarchaeobius sp. TZWWS8]|uniref:hypothetical protein n=1 Tax=Haloarchaeobius sp. TZWWS8 TaxID=3446121 RepID=UPI003EBAA0DF